MNACLRRLGCLGRELWLKPGDLRQRYEWRHSGSIALELIKEDRYEVWIELRSAQPQQLVRGKRVRLGRLVRPAVDHRLVRVGNRDDACPKGYLVAPQP